MDEATVVGVTSCECSDCSEHDGEDGERCRK